jgi:hypothetical protein
MDLDPKIIALVKQRLDEAERNIQYVRQVLDDDNSEHASFSESEDIDDDQPQQGERVVEGVFDGKNMQGNDGEEYPIPPNYASKSKLVEGDILKLTIGMDGSFTYKQISPIERHRVVGRLVVDDQGNFGVQTSDKTYSVLLASVTFYKAEEGDEPTILLPVNGDAQWGAVDNVIHQE